MRETAYNRIEKNKTNVSGGLSGLLALLISYALMLDPEASPKVEISPQIKTTCVNLTNVNYKRESPHS